MVTRLESRYHYLSFHFRRFPSSPDRPCDKLILARRVDSRPHYSHPLPEPTHHHVTVPFQFPGRRRYFVFFGWEGISCPPVNPQHRFPIFPSNVRFAPQNLL